MTIQMLMLSITLFVSPFISSNTNELDTTEKFLPSVCEDKLDVNGMFVESCLPDMGFTCTIISPNGSISFGASPWDPTGPIIIEN